MVYGQHGEIDSDQVKKTVPKRNLYVVCLDGVERPWLLTNMKRVILTKSFNRLELDSSYAHDLLGWETEVHGSKRCEESAPEQRLQLSPDGSC